MAHLNPLADLSHVILRQVQELFHKVTIYKTLCYFGGVVVVKGTVSEKHDE